MVAMAEEAFHMALLLVHAILVFSITFWTMAFNTVDDFLRRRPFCGLPSSLEVFIEMMHHGEDHLLVIGTWVIFPLLCSIPSWQIRPIMSKKSSSILFPK